MRRPWIVGAGNTAHFAVPYIAETSTMAKDMKSSRVPVLRSQFRRRIRIRIVDEDTGLERRAGMVESIEYQVRPHKCSGQTVRTNGSRYVFLRRDFCSRFRSGSG